MRFFQDILKNTFSHLKFIFLFISSFILFQSCNLSGKNDYNEGYKTGYTDGYNDAASKLKQTTKSEESNTTVADPNFNATTEETTNIVKGSVPQKAYQVLSFIREKNKAPDGYVGGRQFGNYEGHLPKHDAAGNKITYREWDIQPKEEGQNRGAQRLVTGSDGRAWYTGDHYNSFTEISAQLKK